MKRLDISLHFCPTTFSLLHLEIFCFGFPAADSDTPRQAAEILAEALSDAYHRHQAEDNDPLRCFSSAAKEVDARFGCYTMAVNTVSNSAAAIEAIKSSIKECSL